MRWLPTVVVCFSSLVCGAQEIGNSQIRPRDVVHLIVRREPGLSRVVSVGDDGLVVLPLLGRVSAAGLTTKQLAEVIEQRLHSFVAHPEIKILIEEKPPGDVPAPGHPAA